MLDGINYALDSGKDSKTLEAEFNKAYGEESDYLEKDRLYRCEEDIFEDMDSNERDRLFGPPQQFMNRSPHLRIHQYQRYFAEAVFSMSSCFHLTIRPCSFAGRWN